MAGLSEKLIDSDFQFLVAGGTVIFYDLKDSMITVPGLSKLTFTIHEEIIDIAMAGGGAHSFAAGQTTKQVTLDFSSALMARAAGGSVDIGDLMALMGTIHLFVEPNDDILSNYTLYDCVPVECSSSIDTATIILNVTGDVIEEEK